jgi:hypothetical protein
VKKKIIIGTVFALIITSLLVVAFGPRLNTSIRREKFFHGDDYHQIIFDYHKKDTNVHVQLRSDDAEKIIKLIGAPAFDDDFFPGHDFSKDVMLTLSDGNGQETQLEIIDRTGFYIPEKKSMMYVGGENMDEITAMLTRYGGRFPWG